MTPVEAALAKGRKIDAIKHYRNLMGVGLKEAKKAVETMARDGEGRSPSSAGSAQPRGAVETSSGCGSVVLVGIGLAWLAWIL